MRRATCTLPLVSSLLIVSITLAVFGTDVRGADAIPATPEFRPHAEVLKDFKQVVSSADGKSSLYTIFTREKDGEVYAELPSSYASDKYFFALTISSGERFAGLQGRDLYVYWRRYDKKLALIAPNVEIRSTGDSESKSSVERLFTDRVLLEVNIETMGPGGGPVIDMDRLLVEQGNLLFGKMVVNPRYRSLVKIKKAKAFAENVEIAFEVPSLTGQLQTLHYSISRISGSPGYQSRAADERIGYFTTSYSDFGKYSDKETRVRFINRWHLEKREPGLKLSPPKKPITFYIEHTTPIRYRRWVKQGILEWNKAFEKVGIVDAIDVQYQDANASPISHMEKDPEDVRWNFVRWLNNDVAMAIGPSRVNPETGEILDSDIILTDGWIRHYREAYSDVLPQIAVEGMNAKTLAWLADHPDWDPRLLLVDSAQRATIKAELAKKQSLPYGGHPMATVDNTLIGDDEFDGLFGRTSQVNGMCLAAKGLGFDMAFMRMHLDLLDGLIDGATADDAPAEAKKPAAETKKPKEELIDGMPESFVGPLLSQLVAHEVGHTLGLRHNFKGSSIYKLSDINSEQFKGKKTLGGSVMDYTPININMQAGPIQGDFAMLGIGLYDMWAIEYGYSLEKDLKPILARVAEPELQYGTDEDVGGPDPLAQRYDFSSNPLEYANNQMRLVQHHRGRLVSSFVKDGESWSNTRRGYELTLQMQFRSLAMSAGWVGGSFVHRDKKGDKNARVPIETVSTAAQREALKFVLENAFRDQAFGLTPEMLNHMTVDKWLDDGFFSAFEDPTWPIHDRIMGIQGSTLTMLMNPSTLERVCDNEYRATPGQDAFTLAELLLSLKTEIWSELDQKIEKQYTARDQMISSLRRNLQQEHLKRLIDLSIPEAGSSAAFRPISNLSLMQLRELQAKIDEVLKSSADKLDPYTKAHLTEAHERIKKALEVQYIYNTREKQGGGGLTIIFQGEQKPQPDQPSTEE